jgi:hypothetical protein
VAEFDFQKLGSDRFSQNIKRAITNPVGSLSTGDISKGVAVDVEFSAETTQTATVAPRRTGAILLDVGLDSICEIIWHIEDTLLTVTLNASRTGTVKFWVF